MRHKIVIAVCLIAVFALGALSVNAWHNENVQRQVAAAKAASAQAYHVHMKKAAVADEQKRITDECHKGQVSYDAQTPAYKKLHATDRPICDLPVVQ